MVLKENHYSLGYERSHIGVVFDYEETHQWNAPGGYLCYKLLIFLDGDIFARFHLTEAVILLSISIKISLVYQMIS